VHRRTFLIALAALPLPAFADGGAWTALVVMRRADCSVCLAEIAALVEAGATVPALRVRAITHGSAAEAAHAARLSGVPVGSDPARIRALGLWDEGRAEARPAVILFDPCGREVGRVLGRGPGHLAAPAVVDLYRRAPRTPCEGRLAT
jgi:hypothetical protein